LIRFQLIREKLKTNQIIHHHRFVNVAIEAKKGEDCHGIIEDLPMDFDEDLYFNKLGFSKRTARKHVNIFRKKMKR